MKNKSAYVEIDYDKLNNQLKKRGLTAARASMELGFSKTYFGHIKDTGRIAKSTMILLDKVLGIKEEEYALKEEEPEQQITDYDKLYEIIYTAVYQAVKLAWKES